MQLCRLLEISQIIYSGGWCPKFCINFLVLLDVLHLQPILTFSILSYLLDFILLIK
jgi:hypothetical protein